MIMRHFFLIPFALILTSFVFGQKLSSRAAQVSFEASVPSFEEVAAKNNSSSAVLDTKTGKLAVLSLVKGFKFKVALMEEHFNENYVKSKQFPKATFSGTISDFSMSKISTSSKSFKISGTLFFNGVKKKVSTNTSIYKSGDKVIVKGDFHLKPEDFNIKIPSVVSKKIADKVKVSFNLSLK